MAWTGIARREHSRAGLRYPSDMTDREWLLTAPFIPPAKSGGRPRTADMREVVNALLYIAASGCSGRLLPKCFAPVSTVRRYFYAWRDTGLFDAINMVLVMNLREIEGREASPSAGVIDSQSVKTTESGGICGYDAGKKVKGRKRHIVTDTCGFLVFILLHAADIQDRDGAVDVLKAIRYRFPCAAERSIVQHFQILAHGTADCFGRQAFFARHRALPVDIGADEAGIDCKAFTADQPLGHAALNSHLEQLPQQVAIAEAPMPVFEKVE